MKILSLRKGFQADHSSTSYEFYAIDKPLNKSQRAAVGRLSSRAVPTKRRVGFIYHGDWADLPGSWEPLVEKYYDIMYTESYDWWTLAMAFPTEPEKIAEIRHYEFCGCEDLGVSVYSKGKRVIVSIDCRLDASVCFDDTYSDYNDYDFYDEDEDEEIDEDTIASDDSLLNLLAQNREYLKNGDYRLLYGVWQKYGMVEDIDEESEEDVPPEPSGMDQLPEPVQTLLSLLE